MTDRASEAAASPRRPVGLLAAALAGAITVVGLLAGQAYALRLARRHVLAVAAARLPIKFEGLTFQRAALQTRGILPVYGSSELYCCGQPNVGSPFFARVHQGFVPFSIGKPGTGDLLFLETFGALGDALRGRRVVISDSPPWFFGRDGITTGYDATFSPEIAAVFTFDAPLPPALRARTARYMLRYPRTLRHQGLLRWGLLALTAPAPVDVAAYALVDPLGRLLAWGLQLQDAWNTVRYIRTHRHAPARPLARSGRRRVPARPRAITPAAVAAATLTPEGTIDWTRLVSLSTRLEARLASDPFGFPNWVQERGHVLAALRLYCSGRTNRNGGVLPYPTAWQANMTQSLEWSELGTELAALRALGARALVWSIPLPGVYDDYTEISRPVRQTYYARFAEVAGASGFPWTDFRTQDEDRYFLTDPGAHFSPRGWVFADRVLQLFWDGASNRIPAALERLAHVPPVAGPPAPPEPHDPACAVARGVRR